MKRLLSIILVFALVSCVSMAQRALMIRHADGVTDAVSTAAIDSLEFSDDGSVLNPSLTLNYPFSCFPALYGFHLRFCVLQTFLNLDFSEGHFLIL